MRFRPGSESGGPILLRIPHPPDGAMEPSGVDSVRTPPRAGTAVCVCLSPPLGKGLEEEAITLADISMAPHQAFGASNYGRVSANVIDLCNQLRQLGVSSDIKLPTLATAGNQSSGKSSVVEAIAGIPLPRSSGTCTRCPTEVRMRQVAEAGLCLRLSNCLIG